MGNKSTVFKFCVILLLISVVCLQMLSMKQSDRLFERLVRLERQVAEMPAASARRTTAHRETEKDGDWLIMRIAAEPPTLNPITSRDYYSSLICRGTGATPPNIFESLAAPDPDSGEYYPLLAESWEISDDGLSIEFVLKEDIWFSDGEPITADDVVFSFSLIKNPKIDNAHLANFFEDVESCEKIDERTVRFNFSQVYFKSLEIVGSMSILPKHIYSFEEETEFNQMRSNPVGSGPYVFEKWDVGSAISLVRNENYWGEKPHILKIIYRVISNDLAAVSAMRAGNIDFVGTTPEQFVRLSKDEDFLKNYTPLSYWTPGNGFSYIGWNADSDFFSDKLVRQAMTHLVDRESIKDHIYEGMAKVVVSSFYHNSPQYNNDIEPWPYDPQRAVELLNKAGWKDTTGDGWLDKDGKRFRFRFLATSGNDTRERIIKLLQDDFSRVGIDLVPDLYEWSVFIQKIMNREFDATTLAWTGTMEADPYQIWHSSQIEGGGSNRVGFNNPEADALIEKARRTLDADERNKLYHRFQEILHEQQPYTFMFSTPSLGFISNRFQNVEQHKLGLNWHNWYVPVDQRRY